MQLNNLVSPALSGIVNAILRRATRETEDFEQGLQQAHGLPSWLLNG